MIEYIKKYFLLVLFYSTTLFSTADNIHYTKIVQDITILSELDGYTSKITRKGIFLNKSDKTISIIGNELEEINGFKSINPRLSNSFQKNIIVREQHIATESFYDRLKEYTVQYTDTSKEFVLEYDKSCKHLILLSLLDLVYYPHADTLIYRIKSPSKFFLKLNVDTSFHFFTIDTVITSLNDKIYTIVSFPKRRIEITKSFHSQFEINKFIPPSIRVIIISAGKHDEWSYFNNWFNHLIADNIKLKKSSLKLVEPFIDGNETEEEMIKKIYNYVNSNIKYVAIENGLEGFRPRDVNSILLNKYGDCKDMANLLCQVLRHFKIEASIAVVATKDHPYQMDFPSLASANHAVCIVKTKLNKMYYLDATDKAGSWDLPSQFIQGQRYFAFNDMGGEKNIVPVIGPLRNRANSVFRLKAEGNSLTGNVENDYLNYSGAIYKYIIRNSTVTDAKQAISQKLNQLNPNVKFSNINTELSDSIVRVNSNVSISNIFNNVEEKRFLLLKFLIFPHQYPKKISDNFRFVTYQTNNATFIYQIDFNCDVTIKSKLKDFVFNNGIMSFDFRVKVLDKRTLVIEYNYKVEKIELNGDDVLAYEKLNEDILKILNTSIEYEIIK